MKHDLFKTGDKDAPDAIKDRNGEVVLGMCRVCRKGESELDDTPVCPGPKSWLRRFQDDVNTWVVACFGSTIAMDKVERNHRFLEEALELVQAAGTTREEALQLVDYVFNRPVGELASEIGGAANTLAALCTAHGMSLDKCAEDELRRCWGRIERIREKQANKPKFGPLP